MFFPERQRNGARRLLGQRLSSLWHTLDGQGGQIASMDIFFADLGLSGGGGILRFGKEVRDDCVSGIKKDVIRTSIAQNEDGIE